MKSNLLFFASIVAAITSVAQTPVKLKQNIILLGHEFQKVSKGGLPGLTDRHLDSLSRRVEIIESIYESEHYKGIDYFVYQLSDVVSVLETLRQDSVIDATEDLPELAAFFTKLDSTGAFLASFDSVQLSEASAPVEEVKYAATINESLEENVEMNAKVNSKMVDDCGWCPRITIGGSPEDWVSDLIKSGKKLLKSLRKMTPKKLEEWSTQAIGQTLKFSGKTLQIMNEEVTKPLMNIQPETVNFIEELGSQKNKFVKNVASKLSSATGTSLPNNLEKEYAKFYKKSSGIVKESLMLTHKAMELQANAQAFTANFLQEFGKYLLLASTGFPSETSLPGLNLDNSKGLLRLDESLFQALLIEVIKDDLLRDLKNLSLLASFDKAKIELDDKSNTLFLSLTDAKIRASHSLAGDIFENTIGDNISGTITIKKVRLQLIPKLLEDAKIPTLRITARVVFLDIKDLLPKLDQTVAWILQKQFLSKQSFDFEVGSLLKSKLKIPGGLPSKITVSTSAFSNTLTIVGKSVYLGYGNSDLNPDPLTITDVSTASTKPAVGGISVFFLQDLVNSLIKPTDGIKFTLDKKIREEDKFDPDFNHLHLKEINSISANENGIVRIDANVQLLLRKFLGRKPKASIGIPHVTFDVTPRLTLKNNVWSIVTTISPVTEEIKISGVSKWLTRKSFRLLKEWKQPIIIGKFRVDPIDLGPYDSDGSSLDGIQNFGVDHPFVEGKKLTLKAKDMSLEFKNGAWILGVAY